MGWRIYGLHVFARAIECDFAADVEPDFPSAIRALQQHKIPIYHRTRRGSNCTGGRSVALWVTGTPFSVSSGIGFLALFGVSVQTAVVYISYVNELRSSGIGLREAIREGAILRLRPIMMTALVAALGLLPAALATGVGTDTQRPFALVIVSGLFSRLLISIFLMPALYTHRGTAG